MSYFDPLDAVYFDPKKSIKDLNIDVKALFRRIHDLEVKIRDTRRAESEE